MIELYDCYRTSLMNAKYYARRLHRVKLLSTLSDCLIAVVATAGFASLVAWKSDLGKTIFTSLVGITAALSATRPILRLPDKIDRISKLHYGYLELYYRIEALVSAVKVEGHLSQEHIKKADDLTERFRALELEGDAYQDKTTLLKYQDEIDQIIPPERLWLPSE